MSSNYVEPYPVVAGNPVALFLMYKTANTVVYPMNANSNITPCTYNVQSFNNVQFVKELPP